MGRLTHILMLITLLGITSGKYNKKILMSSSKCGQEFSIDGALVTSDSFASTLRSCSVTFKGDEDYMLVNLTDVRITKCDTTKISVHFAKSVSLGRRPDYVISCTSPSPGVVSNTGRYVTLVFEGTVRSPDHYNIILTSYHTNLWNDCEFRCHEDDYCIDKDLKCDRIDHCSDNSDEEFCLHWDDEDTEHIEKAVKMTLGVIVGVVIAVVVLCIACCVGIICCCKRSQGFKGRVIRGPQSQTTTTTAATVAPPAAQPLMPMQGQQPGAYPAPQPAGYPQQPAPYPQQPAPYPQQPAPYPQQPGAAYPPPMAQPFQAPPPAYNEVPGPYPAPEPTKQPLHQSAAPSAPPPN